MHESVITYFIFLKVLHEVGSSLELQDIISKTLNLATNMTGGTIIKDKLNFHDENGRMFVKVGFCLLKFGKFSSKIGKCLSKIRKVLKILELIFSSISFGKKLFQRNSNAVLYTQICMWSLSFVL